MNAVQTASPDDPLLVAIPLSCRAEYYPFGFPVSIVSNSALVLKAAEQSWGGMARRFDERPIEVRCLVVEGAAVDRMPPHPVVRAQRNLLVSVADAQNFYSCDLANATAAAWVTATAVRDFAYFRYHFLEAMAYSLIEMRHLVAVHAACVSLQSHGVLLAGDSGAGKSSLAYACARRGWVYTSDDSSSLLLHGHGRTVLGNPRVFRFRETAGELFPEFRGFVNTRRASGKPTIEIRTASVPGVQTSLDAVVEYVIFLNRRDGAKPGFVPLSCTEAWRRLFFDPWPPELPVRAERHAAVRRLLTAQTYELRYRDLDDAVDRLEELVRGGSR